MSENPILNFAGFSGADVLATYVDLPASSRIVFVNRTSGQTFGGVDAAGSGSATIPPPTGLSAGEYYLKAQDSTGAYLAQSVVFYIDSAGA